MRKVVKENTRGRRGHSPILFGKPGSTHSLTERPGEINSDFKLVLPRQFVHPIRGLETRGCRLSTGAAREKPFNY
jgi:hypothetical protein